MRKTRGPTALIPKGFDPLAVLPQNLWMKADAVRWLIGRVISRGMYGHADEEGYVRLNATIIRSVLDWRTWKGVREALIPSAFETKPHIAGVRCRGYRVRAELCGPPHRFPLVTDTQLIAKLEAYRTAWRALREQLMLPVHQEMRSVQKRLTIADGVDQVLDELHPRAKMSQVPLLNNIRDHRASFSVSGTGRVFHAFSGLSKKLRPYLRLDGESLVGVDIGSCQPALLGLIFHPSEVKQSSTLSTLVVPPSPPSSLLPSFSSHVALPAACPGLVSLRGLSLSWCRRVREFCGGCGSAGSVLLFVANCIAGLCGRLVSFASLFGPDAPFAELALGGSLYDFLLEEVGRLGEFPNHLQGTDVDREDKRDWIKKRFVKDVLNLNPRNDYPSPVKRVMRAHFPGAMAFCAAANRARCGDLVATLQSLEAALVVRSVIPVLQEQGVPCLSLHDSVWAKKGDVEKVEAAFEDVFGRLGFRLALKTEG